jgi:hypothetical protein
MPYGKGLSLTERDLSNPPCLTLPEDIQTLARMTGKDFSGPVPEIHARAPLSLVEPTNPSVPDPATLPHDDRGHDEEIIEAMDGHTS